MNVATATPSIMGSDINPMLRSETCPSEPGESLFGIPLGEQLASPSRDGDPVSVLLAREHLECVLAALPTLTAKERNALIGVLNDKSHQQVADEQGSTRKAVSTALRRARKKLAVPETLAA
jgi:DNA-directed RNA polymerase specialized sigma24 family protein